MLGKAPCEVQFRAKRARTSMIHVCVFVHDGLILRRIMLVWRWLSAQ